MNDYKIKTISFIAFMFIFGDLWAQSLAPVIPRGPQYSKNKAIETLKLDTSVVSNNSAIIPEVVETKHVAKLRSGSIEYKAQSGYIQLKDEDGNPKGNVFFIAYVATNRKDRPVTFAFNGGPGSASVWVLWGQNDQI